MANALNPAKYGLTQIKGGSFMMGSDVEDDEKPIHKVLLDDFALGTYEVTNLAYAIFLNRYFSDSPFGGKGAVKAGAFEGEDMIDTHAWGLSQSEAGVWEVSTKGYDFFPIINVSWYGANEFCEYYGGHLPSEAEWEYSARGGAKSKGYTYAGSNELDEVAWYSANSLSSTHAVGLKQTNELGLYDMSGNVWEWCWDVYNKKAYAETEADFRNPLFTLTTTNDNSITIINKAEFNISNRAKNNNWDRVLRGGSWLSYFDNCRSAYRKRDLPDLNYNNDGFRFSK